MAITAMRSPVHSLWFLHHPQFRSLIVLALLCAGCRRDEPLQPHVPTIQLTVEDASCTEAWLKATTTEIPATIALLRDNHRVQILRLSISDSLLIDEGLLPNHTYSYQLQTLGADSGVIETTKPLQVSTMDTTSHNYTWQIDTLGDGSSSVLYDAAIINDTLAYAVGEMYLRDSTGQIDPQAWNAAKWNGQQWELRRIPFIGPCSAVLYPPLKAIWAFSATNILVTNGGSIVRYDGANATMDCGMNALLDGAINKIWASAPQDVYVVGNVGTIVHCTSGTWQRMESGVTANIQDVWGYTNQSGATTILAVASPSPETEILSISNGGVQDTLSWFPNYPLSSTWMCSTPAVYVASQGVWRNRGSGWHGMVGLSNTFYTGIRGSCENNVAAVSWGGVLSHFNGTSWRTYTQIPSDFFFEAVAVSQDMIVAVGYTVNGVFADKAAVAIGRRIQ